MTQPDDPGIFGGDEIREIDVYPLLGWLIFAVGAALGALAAVMVLI